MLANHDHVTSQRCDRLEAISIGFGLVRLLQDAKRFEEARTVLYSLEGDFPGVAEESEPSPNLVKASPTMTDVAQMLTMPLSIA
jgi:hypothetical protein